MSNGVEVNLPGGIAGKASGSAVIMLLGFLAMSAAIVGMGYLTRESIRDQTAHFNIKVLDVQHEIERSCGRKGT